MGIIKSIQRRLSRNLVNTYQDLRSNLGLNEHFFREARGSRIIIYHGICQHGHTRFNSIFLKAITFEKHLQFYKKYFNVISLNDYYNERFDKNKFNVCLSFDDGFANNFKYVLPLIEKYQLPCTFFITGIRQAGHDILWNDFLCQLQAYGPATFQFRGDDYFKNESNAYISKASRQPLKDLSRFQNVEWKASLMEVLKGQWPQEKKSDHEDFWLQMNLDEIKALAGSSYSTIGAHGYSHDDLARIPIEDARKEILKSKQFLENLVQRKVDAMAFPYGSYSREVISASKETGFEKLLAMDFLFDQDNEDETMRERFTVNPYISVNNQMRAIILRKYN